MICENCGAEKKMHYILFCPKCNLEVLKPKVLKTYDLFKIMYHMEANGYMSKNRFWENYFLNEYYVENDTTLDIQIDIDAEHLYEDLRKEVTEYFKAMKKILNLEEDEKWITVYISW